MSDLVLYHAVPSRSMTVHWMLEEVGEPYDIELLSLEAEDHKKPEYLKINPMGRVPALRHGDVVVTETAAIIMYLAETFADAGLNISPGSADRGSFLRWMFFAPVSAEPSVLWKAQGDAVSGLEYQPFSDVETVANTLRLALQDREFIVGDHFSAADVMIGSTIMWGTSLMPVMPKHPELIAYWQRLEQRPAWQKASTADRALMK